MEKEKSVKPVRKVSKVEPVKNFEAKSVKVTSVKPVSGAVLSKLPSETYYGTGKRKSAIARVWLFKSKEQITINDQTSLEYSGTQILANEILRPLKIVGLEDQYSCKITVLGGGIVGQVGACRLGISRALLVLNPEFRKVLKEQGFLTRDSRVKERKKYGRKRARKGFQFRKR